MTKVICDICGKDIVSDKYLITIKNCAPDLSSYGFMLDMCEECRKAFDDWVMHRKIGHKASDEPNKSQERDDESCDEIWEKAYAERDGKK